MEEQNKRIRTYGELEDDVDRLKGRVKELEKIVRRKKKYIGRLEYSERLVNEYLKEHGIQNDYEYWREQEEKKDPFYESVDSNDESSETDD